MGDGRIFRHVNDRIRELSRAYGVGGPLELICECRERGCTASIRVEPERYDDVRRAGPRFVVAPGHVEPGEHVVRLGTTYWIVEEQR